MTPEGTLSYIETIFNTVAKTATEERSYESDFRNALSLYMIILHNCRGIFDTYLPMMNDIVLAKLGHHVSAAIPLTWIDIFQVLILALLYNPHL